MSPTRFHFSLICKSSHSHPQSQATLRNKQTHIWLLSARTSCNKTSVFTEKTEGTNLSPEFLPLPSKLLHPASRMRTSADYLWNINLPSIIIAVLNKCRWWCGVGPPPGKTVWLCTCANLEEVRNVITDSVRVRLKISRGQSSCCRDIKAILRDLRAHITCFKGSNYTKRNKWIN